MILGEAQKRDKGNLLKEDWYTYKTTVVSTEEINVKKVKGRNAY